MQYFFAVLFSLLLCYLFSCNEPTTSSQANQFDSLAYRWVEKIERAGDSKARRKCASTTAVHRAPGPLFHSDTSTPVSFVYDSITGWHTIANPCGLGKDSVRIEDSLGQGLPEDHNGDGCIIRVVQRICDDSLFLFPDYRKEVSKTDPNSCGRKWEWNWKYQQLPPGSATSEWDFTVRQSPFGGDVSTWTVTYVNQDSSITLVSHPAWWTGMIYGIVRITIRISETQETYCIDSDENRIVDCHAGSE